jgi:hypothetical protein
MSEHPSWAEGVEEHRRKEEVYRSMSAADLHSLVKEGKCDVVLANTILWEKWYQTRPLHELEAEAARDLPRPKGLALARVLDQRRRQGDEAPRFKRGRTKREPPPWDDAVGPDAWRVQGA